MVGCCLIKQPLYQQGNSGDWWNELLSRLDVLHDVQLTLSKHWRRMIPQPAGGCTQYTHSHWTLISVFTDLSLMWNRCRCLSGGNMRKERGRVNPRDDSSQNVERSSIESHSTHEDGAAWRPGIPRRQSSQRNPPRISGTHRAPLTHVSREQLWLRSTSQWGPVQNPIILFSLHF